MVSVEPERTPHTDGMAGLCCAFVVFLVFGQVIFPTVWNADSPTPPPKLRAVSTPLRPDRAHYLEQMKKRCADEPDRLKRERLRDLGQGRRAFGEGPMMWRLSLTDWSRGTSYSDAP